MLLVRTDLYPTAVHYVLSEWHAAMQPFVLGSWGAAINTTQCTSCLMCVCVYRSVPVSPPVFAFRPALFYHLLFGSVAVDTAQTDSFCGILSN